MASTREDAFVVALKAPTAIGANTTVWINADAESSTGYLIWGFAGGAEYFVNVDADGKLALYSGAAGQTLVSAAIDYSLSADGTTLEFAVPSSLLAGAPHALTTYIDVNDQVFLSNNYAGVSYKVAETVVDAAPRRRHADPRRISRRLDLRRPTQRTWHDGNWL